MPSPSSSTLTRHIPAIVTGVTVAAVLISYHLYVQKRKKDKRRLRRSNARRIRNPQRNSGRTTTAQATATGTTATATTNQTAVAAQQATPRPATDGTEVANSSEDNVITTAQLEQQLEEESALDEDNSTHPETLQEVVESEFSFSPENSKEHQNLLNLLYLIAEDQAKREGYVHRGVTCNSCQAQPIRGIRYRCANCVDFDLCEHCESLESHPRTHLFYKVRIPAQFLGNPRHVQPPSYPGKPGNLPLALGMELVKEFEKKSGFDQAEVEALYEQFKCLAATEYPGDPYRIGGAISRKTFDKCHSLTYTSRSPAPNLIYDRMFALYDTNNDGLIGFEEFILGLSALHTKLRPDDKWRRIYRGYDLDGDGYVERRDFLKMFRAYYQLSKEHVQDIVASMEEEMIESGTAMNVLLGSQPISAAFPSLALQSRVREGKAPEELDQDMFENVVLPNGNDLTTKEEMDQFREATSGKELFGYSAAESSAEYDTQEEEEEVGPATREVLGHGGEDGGSIPVPGSSNVPAITTTEASTSSATPFPDDNVEFYTLAEDAEDDVGNEVLYQVTQQGLNELLNQLFKAKEDGAIEVRKRRERREREKKLQMQATSSSSNDNNPTDVSDEQETLETPTPGTTAQTPDDHTATPTTSTTPPISLSTPSPPSSSASASARPSQAQSTKPPISSGSSTSSKVSRPERRSKIEADHEKYLDRIEAEIRDRGGPGRINYEEFERLMRQDGWRRYAFVGSWVEMASF